MDLQQLRCFLAVAREGHFGRAAERLHLTTSPVSRAVKDLERELGTELFVRRYHRVELTAGGQHLLSRLEPIVAELDQLRTEVRHLADAAARVLRIGATPAAPAAAIDVVIDAARTVDPNRPHEFTLAPSVELLPALANGDVDLAVVHLDLTVAPHPSIDDLGLASLPVVSYTMTAILRTDDPLAERDKLCVADLTDHTYVVMADHAQEDAIREMRARYAARGVRVETLPQDDAMLLVAKVRRRRSFTLVAQESDLGRIFDGARFARVPVVDVPSRGVGVVWRVVDGHPDDRVARIVSRLGGDGPASS